MKRFFVILMTCIMLFAFTSCAPDADGTVTEVPETKVVMEGGSLREGKIFISGDTEIIINNTGDGYYTFRTESVSENRSINATQIPANLLYMGDGAYLAVGMKAEGNATKALAAGSEPKVLTIKGRDIGVDGTGYITVHAMSKAVKNNESIYDMTLNQNEEDLAYFTPEQYPVYEEYYHLDKEALEALKINLGCVILSCEEKGSGSGSSYYGFVTVDDNGINMIRTETGMYDLSEVDSVDIVSSMTVKSASSPWSQKIILSNPTKVVIDQKYDLKCQSTFMIPAAGGVEYVLETTRNNSIQRDFDFRSASTGRNENHRIPMAINRRSVYYLGEITEDSLITLSLNGSNPTDFKIREIATEEKKHVLYINQSNVKTPPMPISPGLNELSFRFDYGFLGSDKTKKQIELAAYNEDGSFYDGPVSVRFWNRHTYGEGSSTDTLYGPYAVFKCPMNDVLDQIIVSINNKGTEDKNIMLSVKVTDLKQSPDYSDVKDIWVIPGYGDNKPVPAGSQSPHDNNGDKNFIWVTAPVNKLVRPDYEFAGYKVTEGNNATRIVNPGDDFKVVGHSSALIAQWTEKK